MRIIAVCFFLIFSTITSGYSQENDIGAIQTNIRAFSGGGKNIKAIDEYRKLFTQTKTHDTELLHRIVMGSLRDEDGYMKMAGAIAVGQLGGSTEAFPFLRDNLKEKDMWIRIWTAVSIGETGDKDAVPNLLYALLNDRVAFVRISAAVALGKLGDASIIPDVAKALKDKEANVRQMAAIALGRIGDPKAIPYLENAMMEEKDTWAKLAAVAALEKILAK